MSFEWSAKSALNKAMSGITVSVCTPTPVISVCKSSDLTQPNDKNKDAYRNCKNCGRHYNYHTNGKCKL